ncbi:hypothetical protein [Streptomyces sp. NPDC101393]|uniref:hypothetical protein n=1 Tax=Streptomyces sp. NPDC101393 TaxID=3366141 RepID=UPI0037FE17E8
MADDRYDWLDKDAAERLLRGDPVSARDGDGAHELRQLLDAAAAVGAAGRPAPTELPGEGAALAAFRKAGPGAGDGARTRTSGAVVPTVHTTRPGGIAERTRLGRPFRHGFAVALAVCAIGGVAVAAGTGVLPTPFQGVGADPEPAATISAAETPGTLQTQEPDTQTGTESGIPSSPGATPGQDPTGRHGTPAPGGHGTPGHDGAPGAPSGAPGHEGTPGGAGDPDSGRNHGDRKKFVLALCRDYESGKRGEMDRTTRRRLERAAGGPAKVHAFCRKFLAGQQNGGDSGGTGGSGGSGGGTRPGDGQGSSAPGGDEDDDSHPSATPSPSPDPGASTPAPTPTGTPSTAPSGPV